MFDLLWLRSPPPPVPPLAQVRGEDDWMAKHFFSGGQMPSDALLLYFQEGGLAIEHHWRLNGQHYALTAEDWLRNLDRNRAAATELLAATYGRGAALMWLCRWRVTMGGWMKTPARWRHHSRAPAHHAHTPTPPACQARVLPVLRRAFCLQRG